ncbi:hypothetical protein J132_07498, partial [Termitomyces sp. J132]
FFIFCCAIVASAAVWNHSLAQAVGWESQIDVYLIFLGCLGLVHIFTIIFIELAYRHSITGRVWFECLWVGIFWIMYLGGAIAATALLPSHLCGIHILTHDTCTSSHLLLAFTWIMTGILLSYFLLLVTASLLQFPRDSQIFHRYVHKFPWEELRRSIAKPPPPPSLPQVFKKMPSIIAPKPQHPPPVLIYNHRAGLSSEYEIESYATPQPTEAPLPAFTPPPALLSMMHKPLHLYDETYRSRPQSYTTTSFYPQQVQAAITPSITPEPIPESHVAPPTRFPTQKQLRLHQARQDEPSPLGNWPRRSILASTAAKVRPKLPPPKLSSGPGTNIHSPRPLPAVSTATISLEPSVSPPVASSSAGPQAVVASSHTPSFPPSFPPRTRPSGPRRRSDGEARATVPELSLGRKVTSYQPGG